MSTRLILVALALGTHLNACRDPDPVGGTESSTSGSTGTTTTITVTTNEITSGSTAPTSSATGGSETVGESSGGISTTGPTSGPSSSSGDSGLSDCVPLACDGATYACGDCLDNDGDGKYDSADPECISPCDDREDAFATGLPGDNMDPCKQDCFFDGNSGGGAGDCAWDLKCDPASPGGDKCPYDPDYKNCPDMQSQECVDTCQVPNGCDCFGCCTVSVDGMSYDIFLGDADCSLAMIETCQMCTKNDDCDDQCIPENCEICFGETEPPPGCSDPDCDGGTPCMVDDMGNSDCPAEMYCQTGCCVPIVPG